MITKYVKIACVSILASGLILGANLAVADSQYQYDAKNNYRADFAAVTTAANNPGCAGFEIVNYSYSSEKEDYTEYLVHEFNKRNDIKLPNGKCVRVNTQGDLGKKDPSKILGAKGSGSLMQNAFRNSEVHVVSPASSLHISLAERDHGAGIFSHKQSLVNSPIVIAMWEDMAKALGWTADGGGDIGWGTIVKLANDPKGWGSIGPQYAGWGSFKYGHTSPRSSNSGLMAVVAEFMAAVEIVEKQEVSDIDIDQITDPVNEIVTQLEKSSVRYGESTGFFVKDMIQHGPDFIHAAVIYESLVISSKDEIKQKYGKNIVAIYPLEGTFQSDHPFAVVNANTNNDTRAAAKLFLDFLMEKDNQQVAMTHGFRPGSLELVGAGNLTSNFTGATDVGILKDLKQSGIAFFGTPNGDVIDFILKQGWQNVKKASDTVIVFDRSGSMQSIDRDAVRAAQGIISGMTDKDTVKLMPFSSYVNSDIEAMLAAEDGRKQRLVDIAGTFLNNGGKTAFLEAVGKAHRYLCPAKPQLADYMRARPIQPQPIPKPRLSEVGQRPSEPVYKEPALTWRQRNFWDEEEIAQLRRDQRSAFNAESRAQYLEDLENWERAYEAALAEHEAAILAWEKAVAEQEAEYRANLAKWEAETASGANSEFSVALANWEAQNRKIKAIIALTDGQDTASDYDWTSYHANNSRSQPSQGLVDMLQFDLNKECNVFVYAVAYNLGSARCNESRSATDVEVVRCALDKIAGKTGVVKAASTATIDDILEDLAAFGR